MIWFWIIFFIVSCIGAKISLLSNVSGGKWFIIACLMSAVPWFPVMSLWTKTILIDSLIYDFLILIAYTGVYLICGAGKAFGLWQYMGLLLTIIGIVMMKSRI